MAWHGSALQEAVLDSIVPGLEAEGFSVFVQPSRPVLPDFLGQYRPDAIALSKSRKIAIEITSSGHENEQKVQRLRDILAGHPDWELRLIYAPPRFPRDVFETLDRSVIERQLERVEAALPELGTFGALLVIWAAFEAAARRLVPSALEQPQPAAQLVDLLAADGFVVPDDADRLRTLSRLRNRAAHGDLSLSPALENVTSLIRVTRDLLALDP